MPPSSTRLTLGSWTRVAREPTENDIRIQDAFVTDHWIYGGRVHEATAQALVDALREPSEAAIGHALFLRLFAEYATALETLGAWGWALRNRGGYRLFLDAFLAYPSTAPRDFFQAVQRNRSGSLSLLLKLPREPRLLELLEDTFAPWSRDECRVAVQFCFRNLRRAADQYFKENEIIRTTYNKAKHGTTMLRMLDLDERQFYVLTPHLQIRGKRDPARYDLARFTVSRQMVGRLKSATDSTGEMIRFIAGITRALLEAELL